MASPDMHSIMDEDFEVIQAGVDTTFRSLEPSITSSIILPPTLVGSTLDSSLFGHEETIKDETGSMKHSSLQSETPLLNCSIMSSNSDGMSSVLRSQSEANAVLERHLAKLEEFSLLADSIKDSQSVKSQVAELSVVNDKLNQELEQARRDLINLRTSTESLASLTELQTLKDDLANKDFIISSLSKQIVELEQAKQTESKAQLAPELTLHRTPNLDEVERLRKENNALHKATDDLKDRLSEECAKRIYEKEQRHILQRQVDTMNLTGGIPSDQINNTRCMQDLMTRNEECEVLRAKIRSLEDALAKSKTDVETHQEITKVLQEDYDEGTRLLTENGRVIEDLKKKLEGYGHFDF